MAVVLNRTITFWAYQGFYKIKDTKNIFPMLGDRYYSRQSYRQIADSTAGIVNESVYVNEVESAALGH